jgi:multidrug efflux pump subunit AcrB
MHAAVSAVLEAARLCLRPILMTSLTFIIGVVPVIVAGGAGAEIRHALGTTVFAGMLGVTFFGLLLTPVFYVLVRRLTDRNRVKESPRERTNTSQLAAPAAEGSHG